MIKKLKLHPEDFAKAETKIYDYFADHGTSLEYAQKLIHMMNQWGVFISEKQGNPYKAITQPRGRDRALIAEKHEDSDNYVGESDPLTPELLAARADKLKVPGNYEWLAVSLWFGLRPEEVDQLMAKDSTQWYVERDRALGIDVLWVYQPKLVAIERDKRWKGIPVIFDRQKEALQFIIAGKLKTPLYKTMHAVFPDGHYTLRAGRKGFIDLMLDREQKLEDISMWMGHQSIETTWAKYRNKKRVSFTRPNSKAG
jgi:hypothetical protein